MAAMNEHNLGTLIGVKLRLCRFDHKEEIGNTVLPIVMVNMQPLQKLPPCMIPIADD